MLLLVVTNKFPSFLGYFIKKPTVCKQNGQLTLILFDYLAVYKKNKLNLF